MTESGTFVINGAERVIVSQLVRSPSVYFGKEVDKKNGKLSLLKLFLQEELGWNMKQMLEMLFMLE